ncbi:MAG: hypothetical protein J3Q66DRAFT_369265 [Benniella sp.]|nr:MAG: hypothetical protein J3Q66DRAFT_369265 [Benniella sp.]
MELLGIVLAIVVPLGVSTGVLNRFTLPVSDRLLSLTSPSFFSFMLVLGLKHVLELIRTSFQAQTFSVLHFLDTGYRIKEIDGGNPTLSVVRNDRDTCDSLRLSQWSKCHILEEH